MGLDKQHHKYPYVGHSSTFFDGCSGLWLLPVSVAQVLTLLCTCQMLRKCLETQIQLKFEQTAVGETHCTASAHGGPSPGHLLICPFLDEVQPRPW